MGLVACGLSVIGVDDVPAPRSDGGASASGGDAGDGAVNSSPPPTDPFEAGIDASPDNCAAACTGGTCDAGWCVIDCKGAACPNGVTCPPGIPCDVRCTGADACKTGVDCGDATACNVLCGGTGACSNGKVRCKGSACRVTCNARDACIAGVDCDAGTCMLRCLEDNTCMNGGVVCHADRCAVECGIEGTKGKDSCVAGVSCRALTSCDLRCLAEGSCKNGAVVAVAGETANVECDGKNSCASVSASAGDSGVYCTEVGACAGGVRCDGGRCATECEDADYSFCCKAGTCAVEEDECAIVQSCP